MQGYALKKHQPTNWPFGATKAKKLLVTCKTVSINQYQYTICYSIYNQISGSTTTCDRAYGKIVLQTLQRHTIKASSPVTAALNNSTQDYKPHRYSYSIRWIKMLKNNRSNQNPRKACKPSIYLHITRWGEPSWASRGWRQCGTNQRAPK